ncbi:MAG: deoxyguanosinetriphosphate triphosphohydrolase [Clostridia bacterium]
MNVKDKTYKIEEMFFSKYATFSKNTLGRVNAEEECPIRTDFQRDRDRIIHSKAFRRLKNKTQVFLKPEGDHFRTRMTHTLDVAQISRSISRALDLNEDLTEAIALGHDLGHTPFGHAGERALRRLTDGKFSHEKQGIRVVDFLERDGVGLNLTFEVRDGILNHNSGGNPKTLEGKVVHFSDRIAYLNHDLDDAIRAHVVTMDDVPKVVVETLGATHSKRINKMIMSIYSVSYGEPFVKMEEETQNAMDVFRKFMFDRVYFSDKKKKEEDKVEKLIELLFDYYKNDLSKLPPFYLDLLSKFDIETVICDYISTMTDTFALTVFHNAFIPEMSV